MVYKAIGLMSGSSLDGLDIAFVHLQEVAGKWYYEIKNTACYDYDSLWKKKLRCATTLSAYDYQLLNSEYGHYLGQQVNRFISENHLHHQVALIASHGHTTFHVPGLKMTSQLGDGSAIAAETGLAVVSDLRALDIALGGQGAPIVPLGEKLLFGEFNLLLNIGGIANVSARTMVHMDANLPIHAGLDPNTNTNPPHEIYTAFDVCPANAILNLLSSQLGREYDVDGHLASTGEINKGLLEELNALDYYEKQPPKSLANSYGLEIVFPLIEKYGLSIPDALRTYVEHVVVEVKNAIKSVKTTPTSSTENKILVTGGGAFNIFLMQRMKEVLLEENILVDIPDAAVVKFKEALIMALLGVLRWREEYTVLSSVTGATKNSIGGALWLGTEA